MNTLGPFSSLYIEGHACGAPFCAAFLSWLGKSFGFEVSGNLKDIDPNKKPAPVILGPQCLKLIRKIGLDERDLIKACAGTFAVGTEINHPNLKGPSFYPYLTEVKGLDGVAFHQIHSLQNLRSTQQTYAELFAPFYLAKESRFVHPSGEGNYRYSLICDSILFDDYMRRAAVHYGFQDKGQRNADLIIKACMDDFTASEQSTAQLDATMPTQMLYQFKGKILKQVAHTQTQRIETKFNPHEPSLIAMRGHEAVWHDNIIDLEKLLSNLRPFDHSYMDVIAQMLLTLFDIWPANSELTANRQEFNRHTLNIANRARDYQTAPFLAAGAIESNKVSPELQTKWEQFLSRGRLVSYDDEPVSDSEWIAYMLALGITPRRIDPLAYKVSEPQSLEALKKQQRSAELWAADMAFQSDYLRKAQALYVNRKSPS